jgi:hypothetical protein
MTTTFEALTWRGGEDVQLLAYGIFPSGGPGPEIDFTACDPAPPTRRFRFDLPLEDDQGRPIRCVTLYESQWQKGFHGDGTATVRPLVACLLRTIVAHGARVAWCMFEGMFHYDHLLTDDICDQVYAYHTQALAAPRLAFDETRAGAAWKHEIRQLRTLAEWR